MPKQFNKPYGEWTLNEEDMRKFKFWMTYDPIHMPEPFTPLAGWILSYLENHAYFYAAEKVNLPSSKGCCFKISSEGYTAVSEPITPTAMEIKERSKLFKEYLKPFMENFEEFWGDFKYKGKVGRYLKEIQEILSEIGIFDPKDWVFRKESFFSKLKKKTNGELFSLFFDSLEKVRRIWEIHFELMYIEFSILIAFEQLCKEFFNFDDTHPSYKKLFQGFDNMVYRFDRDLWKLAHFAYSLRLEEIFKRFEGKEIISEISKKKEGKEWIEEFNKFLSIYGMRTTVPHDIYKPTWMEDFSPLLSILKDYILNPIDYEKKRKEIIEERERTIESLLEKIPEARKDEFMYLLKAAQIVYCWDEDHNYWIEQAWAPCIRYIALEMGNRMQSAGAIESVGDIFFLNPEEIRVIFMPAINGKYDLKLLTKEREKKWREAFSKTPPIITGNLVREEIKDPVMIKIFGLGPVVKPKEKVDIFGYPGSSGIAEGEASVIIDVNELHKVKPGSILVTGSTNPAWTPIFGKIKGIVTDLGGTLSHAAIVAREYGIPAVVGTMKATKIVKNGQKIKIDGNKGYVWILD